MLPGMIYIYWNRQKEKKQSSRETKTILELPFFLKNSL